MTAGADSSNAASDVASDVSSDVASRVEQAHRLAHDVGKYIARIARNVTPGAPVPDTLVPLLIRDLYERPGESFERLSEGLTHPAIDTAKDHLGRLASLEPAVRAGQPEACTEACRLALAIEASLERCAQEHRP